MSEPMFPRIREVLDELLGGNPEEPQEVQDMRKWAREPLDRDGNTNTV